MRNLVSTTGLPLRVTLRLRGDTDRQSIGVGIAGGLALAVLGTLVRHEPTAKGDDLIYQMMAAHPFAVHTFPFGYRIGLPLVAHLLPLNTAAAFALIAWLAAAGAAGFAYRLMVHLGSERRLAAALAVLMCVSPGFLIVMIRQGANTDIATVFFLMAGTYYAVVRDYRKLAVTLLLGVFVREAVLFILPLAYALWASRLIDRRALTRSLGVGLPALSAYLGLRLGLQTIGEGQVPGYGSSLLGERLRVLGIGLQTPVRELRRIFSIYGPLWLTAPLALRDMPFARRGLMLMALSALAMTFALDWGRMTLLAAPVIYPASAFALGRRSRWRAPALLAMLGLSVTYVIYMQLHGVQHGIIDSGPPPYRVQ